MIRDLWEHKDLRKFQNYFEIEVPSHRASVFKMRGEEYQNSMIYEARYAFMNEYNLDKINKAHMEYKEKTSASMTMRYLEGSELKWAEIQNTYLSLEDNYKIRIYYFSGEKCDLQLMVNAKGYWLNDLTGS